MGHPIRMIWEHYIDKNCKSCKGKGYLKTDSGGIECPTCRPMQSANEAAQLREGKSE